MWVRLPDEWADSDVVERIGPLAAWLHVAALSWSNRHGANGLLSASRAARVSGHDNPSVLIERLVEAGLWQPEGDGFRITLERGLLKYQLTHEQAEQAKVKAKERQRRSRSRKQSHVTDGVSNGVTEGVTDSVTRARAFPASSSSSYPAPGPGHAGMPSPVPLPVPTPGIAKGENGDDDNPF